MTQYSADRSLGPARSGMPRDLPLAVQVGRYLIVGGVAFLADFSTLAVLTELLGLHYLWSAAIAFGLGMAVNYVLSVRWVFKVRAVSNRRTEFLLFALIGLIGLGLNQLVLWLATQSLELFYLHSKLAATAIVLGWNFSARKVLLFSAAPATSLPAIQASTMSGEGAGI